MKMPECSDRDVRYYTLFICAIVLMIFSAAATVVCFQLEKQVQAENNQTMMGISETSSHETTSLTPDGEKTHKEVRKRYGPLKSHLDALIFLWSRWLKR